MKKLTINYFYNMLYQVLTLIIPIITAPYLARTLQATANGINNYTSSIVYWFTLIGMLGITLYGNKEIAKVRDNKEKLSKKFWEIFTLQFLSNLISLITFYVIFGIANVDYKTILLIQGLSIFSVMFDVSWFYYGMENIKRVTLRNIVVKILSVISIFIFIKNPEDLALYVFLSVGFSILGQLILWLDLRHYIVFKKVHFKDAISHLKPSILLFVPQIAISIYSTLDKTMLGMIVSDVAEVGFYSKAQQFVNMFLFVITSIGTVMMPRIVNLNANNQKEEGLRYVNNAFDLVMLLAFPMAFGLAAIAPYFINWFLTPEFAKTSDLMMILCPMIIASSLTNVLGIQLLIPMEKTKQYTKSVAISAIVNFVLNLFLIKYFNSYGAAVSTIIAEYLVLIIQMIYTREYINFKSKILPALKYMLFSVIMFFAMILVGEKFGISFTTNLIQFVVGVIIYLILILVSKDKTAFKLFRMLKSFRRGADA